MSLVCWHLPRTSGGEEPAIHRAARLGDLAALERSITAGAVVDTRDDLHADHGPHVRGLTPLMVAARSVDGATVATLRWLLEHGADLHARSEGGDTAAWYAAGAVERSGTTRQPTRRSPTQDHVDRLRLLLDRGADPHETDHFGRSLLVEACSAGDPARVGLLLERGASPEPPPHASRRGGFAIPLFAAAASGSAACVALLLRAGAVPNVLGEGRSALASAGSPDVVEMLVAGGIDLSIRDSRGEDALDWVLDDQIDGGPVAVRTEVAGALLRVGVPLLRGPGHAFSSSRLHGAAFRYDAEAVDFLLAAGTVPVPDSYDRRTPLHGVCWQDERQPNCPDPDVVCERIVRALVAAGNPVDAVDARGRTPLLEGVGGDGANAPAVRTLLDLGADPERADADGETPLMGAARQRSIACLRALLAKGADLARRDAAGRTALDYAREDREVWISLLRGASADERARYREYVEAAGRAVAFLERAIAASDPGRR